MARRVRPPIPVQASCNAIAPRRPGQGQFRRRRWGVSRTVRFGLGTPRIDRSAPKQHERGMLIAP
jgi:hypothetical protein